MPFSHTTLTGMTPQKPERPDFSGMAVSSGGGGVEAVLREVRKSTSNLQAIKTVTMADAFSSLHPDVQKDLMGLCDVADSPIEFEGLFRMLCANNPLFLTQVSDLLEKREVRAKLTTFQKEEEGWCVEDCLEKAFNPDTRSNIELILLKTSGDESVYQKGTLKKVPLRNILPYSLSDCASRGNGGSAPGNKSRSDKTPVAPVDVNALMKAVDGNGPYSSLRSGSGLQTDAPTLEVAEANGEVVHEVSLALVEESVETLERRRKRLAKLFENYVAPPADEKVDAGRENMRERLQKLISASEDRVEFHSLFRKMGEDDPGFLDGIISWLKSGTFSIQDPALAPADRSGWLSRTPRKYTLKAVCPWTRLQKGRREIETDLVNIFAGLRK